jgi:hypothetical protein
MIFDFPLNIDRAIETWFAGSAYQISHRVDAIASNAGLAQSINSSLQCSVFYIWSWTNLLKLTWCTRYQKDKAIVALERKYQSSVFDAFQTNNCRAREKEALDSYRPWLYKQRATYDAAWAADKPKMFSLRHPCDHAPLHTALALISNITQDEHSKKCFLSETLSFVELVRAVNNYISKILRCSLEGGRQRGMDFYLDKNNSV